MPQAQARVPAGRACVALPAPLHARHAGAAEGVLEGARARARRVVLHGDAARSIPGAGFDAVVTSPPYPGLIDYHEQHRYAYELLGLDDLRERELGAAAGGTSREALGRYVDGIAARARPRSAEALRPGGAAARRRQRPPRALPRRPRARRAAARRPLPPARQPAARAAARASTSRTCSSPAAQLGLGHDPRSLRQTLRRLPRARLGRRHARDAQPVVDVTHRHVARTRSCCLY